MVNIDGLFGALGAIPALPLAACRAQHALFDLRDDSDPDRAEVEAQALGICAACPEIGPCAAWLDSLPARLKPAGVVAGVSRRPRTPAAQHMFQTGTSPRQQGQRGRPRKQAAGHYSSLPKAAS